MEEVDVEVDELDDEVVDDAKEKDLLDYDVAHYPRSQQSETENYEIIFLINLSSMNVINFSEIIS